AEQRIDECVKNDITIAMRDGA
ncbi:MAG: hypothetical protein JWM97_344, partial [Phycisphaerales bacterium]|nr:hypothetical protein [Phycisphaerales bacterium]